jgi:Tol biopolymer transport system component
MDARGRNAAQITDTTLNLQFPDYDPTGTRVYCRIESDAFNGIVSVNLGDGAISQVANFGTRPVFNFDVSLDGTKGAVSAALDDDIFSIYVFATSGPLGTERLTTDSTDSPRWSPDGTRLAFLATDGVTKDLTISNADGTDRTIIHSGSLGYLDWSPDGTRLLFTAPIAQDSNLFIINDDGTGLTQITDYSGRNMNGRWSPVQP